MKNTILKIVLFALIICLGKANSMGQNQKIFKMAYPISNNISIDENYSNSTTINPFIQKESLFSLSVNAKVQLNSDKSLVRVILVAESGEEYMVLESYQMIAEQNQIDFSAYGEETAMLNGVVPSSIKIELEDASILLETVSYNNISQNKIQSTDFALASKERKKNQDDIKIEKLTKQIKKNGYSWTAGETAISKMTYQQKKKMFGGILPNLRGFEYYKGGIFNLSDPTSANANLTNARSASTNSLVSSFDWRNRHGKDWNTAVRNQGPVGSCWAHAGIASLEAVINLYYNQQINKDLSEQAFVSCQYGFYNDQPIQCTSLSYVLCKAISTGVVDESCYPYTNVDDLYGLDNNNQPCTTPPPNGCNICGNLCSDYLQRLWKITDTHDLISSSNYTGGPGQGLISDDSLKVNIVRNGPVMFSYPRWFHAMCFVGFGVVKEGDVLYNDGAGNPVTVLANDPMIGKVYWISKNSWGDTWGENGYCKLFLNLDLDDIRVSFIKTPIIQPAITNYQVNCTDADGDGYYYWGIGPRPSTCPVTSHMEEDGDDSNPFLGPYDANYNCTVICPDGFTTLTAPIKGTITQPSCSVTTGSVVLSGLPATGTWKLTRNPGGVITTGTGTSKTISGIPSGTYTFIVSSATQCPSVPSANVVINNPPQSAPIIGTITQTTCNLATGSVALSGLPATGTWTLTMSPEGTTTSGTGTSKTITGLAIGTHTFTVANASGCISVASADVVINSQPIPVEPLISSRIDPSCTVPTGSFILGDLPATGTWTLTRYPDGIITTGTGTETTISGVPTGTYSFSVMNASGCVSVTTRGFDIPAQPTITAPIIGAITQPTSTVPTGSVVLSGLPTSITWTLTRNPDAYTTISSGTSKTITDIPAGTYTYTVTNIAGCTSVASTNVVINTPPAGITVTIGTGTSTQRQPFGMYYGYERSAAIYTSTEIGSTGNITSLAYKVATAQATSAPVKIYVKTTTSSTLTAGSWASLISGATTVYNGTLSFSSTGWKTITLSTPYSYTGNNLLVLVETNYGSAGSSSYPNFYYTTSTSKHEYWNQDNSAPTGNGTVNSNRPNIQITSSTAGCTTPTAPIAGTITQPTCVLPTGSVVLSGLPATGTWTLTRTLGGTTTTGTGTSTTITGIPAGTFNYTVTNAAGCTSTASASIAINALFSLTTPIVGTITQPTCISATGSVVINGLPASGTWTLTRNPGGTTNSGTGTSITLTGIAAGTYTYTVACAPACPSVASANVVINAQPTQAAPIVGAITQPTTTVPTGTVLLSGLPASGTWTLTRNPDAFTTTGSGISTTITDIPVGTYTYAVKNIERCTSVASANVVINSPSAGTTVTIGKGTSKQRQPFGMYYGYERSAAIYTSAEIGGTGNIISLAYNVATAQVTSAPVKIYIKTTTSSTLTTGSWASLISGATTVYNGTLSFSATGWKTITLSTPFNYTGSNLLVLVETNYGSAGSSLYPYFYYTSSATKHEYWSQDNSAPTANGTVNSNRPNIQITTSAAAKTSTTTEETTVFAENNNTIKVYPNPVSNELTIEIEGNTNNASFEIVNTIGQVVFKGNLIEKAVIQTSNFSHGIYLIKIENGETIEFKKFIKE